MAEYLLRTNYTTDWCRKSLKLLSQISSTTPDLKINKWGYIIADEETGKTNKEKLYAGGDIVTGTATVISAMGAGRKSATAIDKVLT